jgi:ribosomal protein S18 acetylase RimI-like enzyme
MIEIVSYKEAYKDFIRSLNYEWLEKYFFVEPNDVKQLADPQAEILDKGGKIYFALYNNEVVGTASLLKVSDDEYELGKMAVTEKSKGLGIGKKLMEYCLDKATDLGAKKISLYSNTTLIAAIKLYEKYGFVAVPLSSEIHYTRADIKMEKHF